MRVGSTRIREAYVQTDGRLRVTAELPGRERPLTFWVPSNQYVQAPEVERGLDLDDGREDSGGRLILDVFTSLVAAHVMAGEVPGDTDELSGGDWAQANFVICGVRGL